MRTSPWADRIGVGKPNGGRTSLASLPPMIVAFDADDTLWHNEDSFDATHKIFAQMLSPWASVETVDAHLFEVEMRNLSRYGYGAKSFTLSMTETAIELSGGEIPSTNIGEIIALGHAIIDRPTELLDDVPEVFEELADHQLMLITKGDLYAQHARIADSGLAEHFWRIEVVAEKDKATYERLLEVHGVDVAEFVMVGNSLRSDVLPVIELGGRGVHVPYHLTWAHEVVDDDHGHEVPTLARLGELPALLAAWA